MKTTTDDNCVASPTFKKSSFCWFRPVSTSISTNHECALGRTCVMNRQHTKRNYDHELWNRWQTSEWWWQQQRRPRRVDGGSACIVRRFAYWTDLMMTWCWLRSLPMLMMMRLLSSMLTCRHATSSSRVAVAAAMDVANNECATDMLGKCSMTRCSLCWNCAIGLWPCSPQTDGHTSLLWCRKSTRKQENATIRRDRWRLSAYWPSTALMATIIWASSGGWLALQGGPKKTRPLYIFPNI